MESRFFYLKKLFGDNLRINILECLLKLYLEEQSKENEDGMPKYMNGQQIADEISASKSTVHQIIDTLLQEGFIEKEEFETHQQNPPKLVRLNVEHPAIKELIFFYKKVRAFL
jgi:DNA-binding MarR family transcriptional regulator